MYIQYYFVSVSGVQPRNQTITYFTKHSLSHFQNSTDTIRSYYNIIDYIPCAVVYISITILYSCCLLSQKGLYYHNIYVCQSYFTKEVSVKPPPKVTQVVRSLQFAVADNQVLSSGPRFYLTSHVFICTPTVAKHMDFHSNPVCSIMADCCLFRIQTMMKFYDCEVGKL